MGASEDAGSAEDAEQERRYTRLRVCTNLRAGDILPSCGARGSKELARALREAVAARGDFISVETVHCLGKCHIGPTLKLLPGGPFLLGAQAEDVPRLTDMLEAEEYETLKAAFPEPSDEGDAGS
jgi:(2Fe-2S) ferredoxin